MGHPGCESVPGTVQQSLLSCAARQQTHETHALQYTNGGPTGTHQVSRQLNSRQQLNSNNRCVLHLFTPGGSFVCKPDEVMPCGTPVLLQAAEFHILCDILLDRVSSPNPCFQHRVQLLSHLYRSCAQDIFRWLSKILNLPLFHAGSKIIPCQSPASPHHACIYS